MAHQEDSARGADAAVGEARAAEVALGALTGEQAGAVGEDQLPRTDHGLGAAHLGAVPGPVHTDTETQGKHREVREEDRGMGWGGQNSSKTLLLLS